MPLFLLNLLTSLPEKKLSGERPTTVSPLEVHGQTLPRNVIFLILVILSLVAFWRPLWSLVHFSLEHEFASHIVLVPLVSGYLLCRERKRIFSCAQFSFGVGNILLLGGVALYGLVQWFRLALRPNDILSPTVFSIVLVWIAGFVLCYGTRAFRAATFPLLFLLLMVPLPDLLLDKAIFLLQKGSAEGVEVLFNLVGVPVLRQGLVFHLPGVSIEIAKECSGIRSTLVLLITCLLAGYFFLLSGWHRTVLILCALPLVIVKNAVRIVTLTLLALYVNPGFLSGSLHQRGGILFFLLALATLAPILHWLQKTEKSGTSL